MGWNRCGPLEKKESKQKLQGNRTANWEPVFMTQNHSGSLEEKRSKGRAGVSGLKVLFAGIQSPLEKEVKTDDTQRCLLGEGLQ
jgi:hypothetical protein